MNLSGYNNHVGRAASAKGFALVELIIVMAIFMGVIIISSQAFNRILSVSSQQSKSAESDTQGIVGLEMLRIDLEHAGYGLPWLLNFVAEFDETDVAVGFPAPGINSEDFNDKYNASGDVNKVPRAIQAGASTTDGRDYLVIKSVLVGMSDTDTVKKWTYVEGLGGGSALKVWGNNDFAANEKVITIDSKTKRLIGTSTAAADFSYAITSANMTPPAVVAPSTANFQPQTDTDIYVVYGVSKSTALRAPYNRVDYYVKRPTSASDIPARCAPGTGILYKAVMNHSGGGFTNRYPLVECIADMQVVFGLDSNEDGGVDLYVGDSGLSGLSAKDIRAQLKEIRVYVVGHEGGKDTGFNYPQSSIVVGEFGSGRTLDLNALVGADYKYYRWKTYTISVKPKNINY